jgi:CRP/FNR family transcriptional regulator
MALTTATMGAGETVAFPRASQDAASRNCTVPSIGMCCDLDAADLCRLAAVATELRFAAGHVPVHEGEAATHLFTIVDGTVKLYKLMPDGRRQVTGFLFAGDMLGFAFSDTYAYNAETVTPVTVCSFPRARLERMLDELPGMQRSLLRMAAQGLAAAQEQMMLLGRKTARERVASFLLMLVRHAEQAGRAGGSLSLPMTRADIGDHLGLTTETVSRTFTQLKSVGCIALRPGSRVEITDRAGLEEIAAGQPGECAAA